MSTALDGNASPRRMEAAMHNVNGPEEDSRALKTASQARDYKGFVAGVFSGAAKLSVGHPFDTIKVRMQTSTRFKGPWDCLMQTVHKEGIAGVYKGASPPLLGWMLGDSLMLGSLTLYRRLLNENVFNRGADLYNLEIQPRLPTAGHGIAGIMAGCTVSFLASPIEHIKARLQIQYQAKKAQRLYSGPVDCIQKIWKNHGIRGIYHGLGATLIFRSFFFFWWSSYDLFTRALESHTSLSAPSVNFWAGGLSAQVFWLTCYPTDVVKQRIMTDELGSARKFNRWSDAAKAVYAEGGLKGYWRGFAPCFLRSFPANAAALTAFEFVMRNLP